MTYEDVFDEAQAEIKGAGITVIEAVLQGKFWGVYTDRGMTWGAFAIAPEDINPRAFAADIASRW